MSFIKEEPVKEEDIHIGCMNCSTARKELGLDAYLAVGFGACYCNKGEETIYDENEWPKDKDYPTLQYLEDIAAKDPDHDYRLYFFGPMHEETYQRQGENKWVMIESGMGFA